MSLFDQQMAAAREWFDSPRFSDIVRLYSPRDVAEQQGTLRADYTVARRAAEAFYTRLRELFAQRGQVTTFGPYSPGHAVAMKRAGIEAIYLGGWATSAKGSADEDPGPDLASYPLSQVPNEAAVLVRALLTADKNQHFARARMSDEQRQATPAVDFSPFILADADTGHGGDAHVRNLIRRFVEAGVPGYHIEDQRPGAKKCGHQAGKVLVSSDEQIKRLNAARFQLDIMRVPGIIVARTDAEAATFLENRSDERDQPFLLGATKLGLPSYKVGYLAMVRMLARRGVGDARGHLLFEISETEYRAAEAWLERVGMTSFIVETAREVVNGSVPTIESALARFDARYSDVWHVEAGLKTFGQAVADIMKLRAAEGHRLEMTLNEWLAYAGKASLYEAAARARSMSIEVTWDCELPKTPEGFYQVQGGIGYAIAKSLAAAPYADLLWMETKTANLEDARRFADAMHAKYPEKMLAYNLSPSFNWDTTGMTDEEMRGFPEELGTLGFVFNFITYGGHQIDGLAAEEFATALKDDGMLALARLQRRLRLLESPYRTPQTLVGGPRLDSALMAVSGRTAATKAMGKGSTQVQHLVQTEVPPRLLGQWVEKWAAHHQYACNLRVQLRPQTAGSELLQLRVLNARQEALAEVVASVLRDRQARTLLLVREQYTVSEAQHKGLMTLAQLFLIWRHHVEFVHYLTPNDDDQHVAIEMADVGIFRRVSAETSHVIVGEVDEVRVAEFVGRDVTALEWLICKDGAPDALAGVALPQWGPGAAPRLGLGSGVDDNGDPHTATDAQRGNTIAPSRRA
ncbi:MAG: isocitrate lyase family protein [Acidobacteria bacterium]|nr:isocitrate lyase family protein [Acidobacteriota bacterium]